MAEPNGKVTGAASAPSNLSDGPELDLDLTRDSLSERIYAHLRMELLTGVHLPGARLSIRKLAAQMNISATPVREAVFQLIREGALELRTGYQPRVPEMKISRYIQIRDTRVPLERLAGELATARIDDKVLDTLLDYHNAYVEGCREARWRDAVIANQNFHFTIYRAAQNEVLVSVIENLWLLTGPFVAAQFPRYVQIPSDVHPHMMIIDALNRRAPGEVGELLVRDLRDGSYRIINLFQPPAVPRSKHASVADD